MQLDTYNLDGEKVGTVEIQNTLIEEEYSLRILQEAIVAYRNEIRQGTHSTLQRSEISGSTRKLWRQKGTGRARVGSVKNPIWRHGPVVFGPQPRDHGAKINQKARRKSVRVALSERVRQEQLSVLEKLELPTHKTKAFNSILCKFTEGKCLIIVKDIDNNLERASRNLPNVKILKAAIVNAYEIVNHERLLLAKDAISVLEERLG
jgi:large subunit ribosomal protein L4